MSWSEIPLGAVAGIAAGGGAPQNQEDFGNDGYPFVRAGSLKGLVSGSSITTLEHLTPVTAKKHKLRLFPVDTVLFAKSGMSALIGLVHRLQWSAYVVNHLAAIVCGERLDSAFLHHYLRAFTPARLIQDAAYPSIRLSDIAELKIPLPPLPEQRRIATILDQADALRAKRREALAQLDSLTQSIFVEMFGDPVTNPRGTKVVHLSDITTRITDGVHQKPNYTDEGVPFISVKDITSGVLKFDQCKFISFDDHKKFTKRCKAEYLDILYTKVGATYGRPALVDTEKEFSLYVSVCLIKPDKKLVDPFFLNAALGTVAIKSQADRRIKGIGVPDLHLDQIQKFLIPLPTLEKQREFAERVASVEKLKGIQREALSDTDALFASIQQRAFRGEL